MLFKRIIYFLIISLLTTSTISAEDINESSPTCGMSDIALIYQGGTHRPDWTINEIKPYVVHTFADGHIDWFFDSFLFFEFTDNWQIGFGYKYGARNAKKEDWEWLLNRIFEKEKSLDALNSCIEQYKKILGAPIFKHKIVLGIVSPITDQADWGNLDGNTLNFSYRSHQVVAAKWYIDQLTTRFNNNNYNNLELIGFYWLEESTAKCGDLPKYISEYIHQQNKRFYWIPYWYAPGFDQWKDLGFDAAFLQPNHFFDKTIIDNRLYDAYKVAKKNEMGLEMEFDSNVLFEKEDSYYSRLETYINAFEKYGVFDQPTIAYYSGTKAILDMYNSSKIENTLILDRIAKHTVERHNRGAGIEAISKNINDISIISGNGEIYISDNVMDIKIYTLSGTLISSNSNRFKCSPGVYIVNADGNIKKIIVK